MNPEPKKENLQLDALSTEQALRKRLSEFAQSVAYLRDPHISRICRRLWESDEAAGGLVGQLWVEGIFPSRSSGRSARDLAGEGALSKELIEQLDRTNMFPTDRALYLHQEQAIRAESESVAGERPAVVVTAATGAGKTENLRPRWRFGEPSEEHHWYARPAVDDGEPFDLASRLCEDSADNIFLRTVDHCTNCGADSDEFAPVGFGDGLALPVVAETLVTAMPPISGPKADWLPARGRRLLVFSDSRREAARR